ncbi:hypothetical protein COCNU_scaffold014295G000020 [Cocos nucifera]|nr:hypothetical protein [Cocos nucifera]
MDPAPEEPAANARGTVRDTYQKWLSDRITVRCIMLVAISDEFSRRFKIAQSNKMLQVLNDSFGTPDDVERHKTSCAIFNARMWDGASITDHDRADERLSKLGFPLAQTTWERCNTELTAQVLSPIPQKDHQLHGVGELSGRFVFSFSILWEREEEQEEESQEGACSC